MADLLRAQTEPEDIVQSVFKSVFRGMNTGNYDAPQGGTLWHLMAVIAVHKVRRNARRGTYALRDIRRLSHVEDLDSAMASESHTLAEMESAMEKFLNAFNHPNAMQWCCVSKAIASRILLRSSISRGER